MPAIRWSPTPPPCARWVSPPPSRRVSSPITCWAIPMPTPSSLAARSPATSSRAGRMWPNASRPPGASGRTQQFQSPKRQQALAQEHVHARRRRRYGPNDPVLHGQGSHGQGQGGLPEIHRLLGANRHAHRKGGREQISANVLRDRLPQGRESSVVRTDEAAAESAASAHVTIRGLTKHFTDAVVYDRFDLDIPRGKLMSVFGPNGCGKSTLINMITGLIPTDGGEILFDGKPLRDIKFGYVFQNYREALFPWLRAIDNIQYPLKLMKLPKAERRARTERMVASLGVKIDLNRYPYELSGGQQQLVSIMRALVVEPQILFLDEPFSALDYEMTLFMRDQLQRIFVETGTTTVLVSHDLEEAVYLADRILLLSRRPACIADYVHYDAARPRTDATLSQHDFVRIKAHCLDVFQREVRKG